MGAALNLAQDYDYDKEVMHLAKAAMMFRKDILAKKQSFNCTFVPDYQRSAVLELLLALVNMILKGPNFEEKDDEDNYADVILSQLLIYNSYKRHREPRSDAKPSKPV